MTDESQVSPTPKRIGCPFYGLHQAKNIMVDSGGNQCPLFRGYSPCKMEIAGKAPNYRTCDLTRYVSKEDLTARAEGVIVFPRDQRKGIPFKNWIDEFQ